MGQIKNHIQPPKKDLGDGFIVQRSLPHIKQRSVGPFIFWDHMGPVELGPGKDLTVRAHPHIGLATITFLFEGEIVHRDSLGNIKSIRPGEVNWMTSGSGIVHSERTHSGEETLRLEGIQVWVALPKEFEEVEPNFYHGPMDRLPKLTHCGVDLTLIAGEALTKKSPVPVLSPLFYLNGMTQEPGEFSFPVSKGSESAVYIINGQLHIDGNSYGAGELVTFDVGVNLEFVTGAEAEFMIFGGHPFPEKRHLWWNFVSSDLEKIDEAKLKWKNGQYPNVVDEAEEIPLPEGLA